MKERVEDIITAIKATELMRKIRKEEEKKSHPVLIALSIVGIVVAACAIAYAIYRYFNPGYADFDTDFDYDEFEDGFDDDFDLNSDEDDDDVVFGSSGDVA